MKKLLILMLVLCLASVASAVPVPPDLIVEINAAGDLMTITGIVDGAAFSYFFPDGTTDLLKIDVLPAAGSYPMIYIAAGDLGSAMIQPGGPTYGDVAALTVGWSGTVGEPEVVAGLWAEFQVIADVTGLNAGDIVDTFNVLNSSLDPVGTINATYIPEPMTIALLGLGGLFLLRRRK